MMSAGPMLPGFRYAWGVVHSLECGCASCELRRQAGEEPASA